MKKTSPLVKGIITGSLMVITSLVLYYSKAAPGSPVHYLIYLLYAAGIIWTLLDYSRSEAFTGKFSDLFGKGFRCFIITILIIVAFTAVFSMTHPEFAEEAAQQYRAELIAKKDKLPADIDKMVSDAKKQYTTGVVYFTIFGYLIIGALINAVGSLFLTRRK